MIHCQTNKEREPFYTSRRLRESPRHPRYLSEWLFLATCLCALGGAKHIDSARQNGADTDFVAGDAGILKEVEESLGLKKAPGRLKNDEVAILRVV